MKRFSSGVTDARAGLGARRRARGGAGSSARRVGGRARGARRGRRVLRGSALGTRRPARASPPPPPRRVRVPGRRARLAPRGAPTSVLPSPTHASPVSAPAEAGDVGPGRRRVVGRAAQNPFLPDRLPRRSGPTTPTLVSAARAWLGLGLGLPGGRRRAAARSSTGRTPRATAARRKGPGPARPRDHERPLRRGRGPRDQRTPGAKHAGGRAGLTTLEVRRRYGAFRA